jgi:2-enoate reductase
VQAVKEVVGVPVIANGKLGDPEIARGVIEDGKADFIALGRPVLADPEWPNKVRRGQLEDIKPCIGCNEACLGRGYEMKYLSCTVNPLTGMEKIYAVAPIERKKSVLVIGGGPGGMEAARVAASRGCEVALWEKRDELGGKMRLASIPGFKRDIRPLTTYLATQIAKAGVAIELGKQASPQLISAMNPDVVVIATGSVFRLPEVPGVDHDHIFSTVDLFEGRQKPGETVAVVGGGLCGCEAAVHLAQQGKAVTLVEMAEELVPEGTNINTLMGIQSLLAQTGVQVLTRTRLVEVTGGGIAVENGGARRELAADSVVMATGFAPDATLREALEDEVPELFAIGDCARPRNILNAIWEGFHTARVL